MLKVIYATIGLAIFFAAAVEVIAWQETQELAARGTMDGE